LRHKLGVRAVTSEEAAEVAIALPSKGETAKLYSQGVTKLRLFDALAARDLLLKAVAAEPDYALSHSELAPLGRSLVTMKTQKRESKKHSTFLPICRARNGYSLKHDIARNRSSGEKQ